MIDKLLLILLIILLPVGIVASKQLFQPNLSEDKQIEAQTKKVEDLMAKLNNQMDQKQGNQSAISGINITSVTNASDSGVLKISGVVPSGKMALYYSATILPKDIIPELNNNQVIDKKVLGETVEMKAIKTNTDGTFVLEYPVKGVNDVIELVLTQDQSRMIIQYDMNLNKRIL
jgi:hypothetical protein